MKHVTFKSNILGKIQKWMDSLEGQTFLNYAYSWGAAIVILGTLFKLTHLPGANFFLFLGMGTEVIVFVLAAFDRPFNKTIDRHNGSTVLTTGNLSGDGDVCLLINHEEMERMVEALKEAYEQRIDTLKSGNCSIAEMDEQVKELIRQIKVLNTTCARMVSAIKDAD